MNPPTDGTPVALSRDEALTVKRPEGPEPYVWPDPVLCMVSDTYKFGLARQSYNGDPLAFAVALEMLRSLYDNGYALVKVAS